MGLQLLYEKIRWALVKRFFKKKPKTYDDWLAKKYINEPEVSFIIQSHNKSIGVKRVIDKLREYPNAEIVVIDDGSDYNHTEALATYLVRGNEFLVRANDLYENVMYDKVIRFVNGKYVVLLQDDDEIESLDWVDKGISYFKKYADLVFLGGRDGLNFVYEDDTKLAYNGVYPNDLLKGKDFCFVHSVNRAPMLLNKELFLTYIKHIDFSYAPFQYDDTEMCLRAWSVGLKVGWYQAGFESMMAGGMRIWNTELMRFQQAKNSAKLYAMYRESINQITKRVEEANRELDK